MELKEKEMNKIHNVNGIIYDKKEVANAFADNFERVYHPTEDLGFTKSNNLLKKENANIIKKSSRNTINNVNAHEIKSLIKKLNNKKAPGIDNVTNLQLKYSTNKILVQLMRIFNYCLKNVYFPDG